MKQKKVKPTQQPSNEQFATAADARQKNIDNMETWLEDKAKEIRIMEFQTKELAFKLEQGFEPVNPIYKYELMPEWQEHLKDLTRARLDQIQRELDAAKDGVAKTQEGLKLERLRLKLINEGVPAWYDDVFEQEQAKNQ